MFYRGLAVADYSDHSRVLDPGNDAQTFDQSSSLVHSHSLFRSFTLGRNLAPSAFKKAARNSKVRHAFFQILKFLSCKTVTTLNVDSMGSIFPYLIKLLSLIIFLQMLYNVT